MAPGAGRAEIGVAGNVADRPLVVGQQPEGTPAGVVLVVREHLVDRRGLHEQVGHSAGRSVRSDRRRAAVELGVGVSALVGQVVVVGRAAGAGGDFFDPPVEIIVAVVEGLGELSGVVLVLHLDEAVAVVPGVEGDELVGAGRGDRRAGDAVAVGNVTADILTRDGDHYISLTNQRHPTRLNVPEKVEYVHNNPVRRRLAASAEEWPWSSCRAWQTGGNIPISIDRESFPSLLPPDHRWRR